MKGLYQKAFLLLAGILIRLNTQAFAVNPQKPPGVAGNTSNAFDLVTGWMMWLTLPAVGVVATWMWYKGIFGVHDHSARAETKEKIQKVITYGALVWGGATLIQAVYAVLGIS
jgi:hypothetical protein